MSGGQSTIFESLPPQVIGRVLGQLSIRARHIKLYDGTTPVNYNIRFAWWGQRGGSAQLSVPWKTGMLAEEAVYPLRSDKNSISQYLIDTGSLEIEIFDGRGIKAGRASLPLAQLLVDSNIDQELVITDSKRNPLGILNVGVTTAFGGERVLKPEIIELEKNSTLFPTSTGSNQNTPERLGAHTTSSARTAAVSSQPILAMNSFQMNEARVFTDDSGRYAEWPADPKNMGMIQAPLRYQPQPLPQNVPSAASLPVTRATAPNTPVTAINVIGGSAAKRVTAATTTNKDQSATTLKEKSATRHESPPLASGKGSPGAGRGGSRSPSGPSAAPPRGRPATAKEKKETLERLRLQKEEDARTAALEEEEEKVVELARQLEEERRNITGTGVEGILSRAQGLLELVSGVRAAAASRDGGTNSLQVLAPPQSGILAGVPGARKFDLPHVGVPSAAAALNPRVTNGGDSTSKDVMNAYAGFKAGASSNAYLSSADPDSTSAQLDWLLRGLPEAYADELPDDEAVEALLQEGGQPPSALLFPSLYASAQRSMDRLRHMRFLEIRLENFLLYSARYGIRRDCSHILVLPPRGCPIEVGEGGSKKPEGRMLMLPELSDVLNVVSYGESGPKHAAHRQLSREDAAANKGMLRDYFVGGIDLTHKEVTFRIDLSDAILRHWIAGGRDGSVRVELHSFLQSPEVARSTRAESQLYGAVNIPLGGLLATESLDCSVTVELDADMATHASVVTRMQSMPYGHLLVRAKPLGSKMGTLRARISLKPDASTAELVAGHSDARDDLHAQVDDPQFNRNAYGRSKREMQGGSALSAGTGGTAFAFVPAAAAQSVQAVRPPQPLLIVQPDTQTLAARAADVTVVPDVVQEALQYVPQEAPRDLTNVQQQRPQSAQAQVPEPAVLGVAIYAVQVTDASQNARNASAVEIRYRVARGLSGTTGAIALNGYEALLPHPTCDLFDISDMHVWRAPVFEVWTTSEGISDNRKRMLLGLAEPPGTAPLNTILELNVLSFKTGAIVGHLTTSLHLHPQQSYVENVMRQRSAFYLSAAPEHRAVVSERAAVDKEINRTWQHRVNASDPLPLTQRISRVQPSQYRGMTLQTVDASAGTEERGEIESHELSNISQMSQDSVTPAGASAERHGAALDEQDTVCAADPDADDDDMALLTEVFFGGSVRAPATTMSADVSVTAEPPAEPLLTSSQVQCIRIAPIAESAVLSTEPVQDGDATHVLDVRISGSCDPAEDLSAAGTAPAELGLFGCYVQYHFPATSANGHSGQSPSALGVGTEQSSLWWDAACAVLNGRCRHRFRSVEQPIFRQNIRLQIYKGDADGCVPTGADAERLAVGHVEIRAEMLTELCSKPGGSTTLALSIITAREPGVSSGVTQTLVLQISHRLEPTMLRPSVASAALLKEKAYNPPTELAAKAVFAGSASDALKREISPVPPATHVSLYVELQALAHVPRSVRMEGSMAPIQVLCAASSVGRVAGTSRADLSALNPGYESLVSEPALIPEEEEGHSWSVRWSTSGVLWVHGANSIGDKEGATASVTANPSRRLRGASLLLQVYTRRKWRGLDATLPADSGAVPAYLQVGDQLIGTTSVDLSALSFGMPSLEGWYLLRDAQQESTGSQVRVLIRLASSEETGRSTDAKGRDHDTGDARGSGGMDDESKDGTDGDTHPPLPDKDDATGHSSSTGYFEPPRRDTYKSNVLQGDSGLLALIDATDKVVPSLELGPPAVTNAAFKTELAVNAAPVPLKLVRQSTVELLDSMAAAAEEAQVATAVSPPPKLMRQSTVELLDSMAAAAEEAQGTSTAPLWSTSEDLVRRVPLTSVQASAANDGMHLSASASPSVSSSSDLSSLRENELAQDFDEMRTRDFDEYDDDGEVAELVDAREGRSSESSDIVRSHADAEHIYDDAYGQRALEQLQDFADSTGETLDPAKILGDKLGAEALEVYKQLIERLRLTPDLTRHMVVEQEHKSATVSDEIVESESDAWASSGDDSDDESDVKAQQAALQRAKELSLSREQTAPVVQVTSDGRTVVDMWAAAAMVAASMDDSSDATSDADEDHDIASDVADQQSATEAQHVSKLEEQPILMSAASSRNTTIWNSLSEAAHYEESASVSSADQETRAGLPDSEQLTYHDGGDMRIERQSPPMPASASPYRRPPTPALALMAAVLNATGEADVDSSVDTSQVSASLDNSSYLSTPVLGDLSMVSRTSLLPSPNSSIAVRRPVAVSPELLIEAQAEPVIMEPSSRLHSVIVDVTSPEVSEIWEHYPEAEPEIEQGQEHEPAPELGPEPLSTSASMDASADMSRDFSSESAQVAVVTIAPEITSESVSPLAAAISPARVSALVVPAVEVLTNADGSIDQDSEEIDSPVTSKVRMVAREEIRKALAPVTSAPALHLQSANASVPDVTDGSVSTKPTAAGAKEQVALQSSPPSTSSVQTDAIAPSTDGGGVENNRPVNPAELIAVKVAHALASARTMAMRVEHERFPVGRQTLGARFPDHQRQFVEAEMERVSRIMQRGREL